MNFVGIKFPMEQKHQCQNWLLFFDDVENKDVFRLTLAGMLPLKLQFSCFSKSRGLDFKLLRNISFRYKSG